MIQEKVLIVFLEAITALMPQQLQEHCKLVQLLGKGHDEWSKTLEDKVLALADVELVECEDGGDIEVLEYALCPLCGGGRIYDGYKYMFPEGLRRHLRGSGKTPQCPPMKALFAIGEFYAECR